MDLSVIAAENKENLQNRYQICLTTLEEEKQQILTEFAECVRTQGAISVNMGLKKLRDLIVDNLYLNPHQRAVLMSETSGQTPEYHLREHLGAYYERRLSFEGECVNGFRFNYGALNIGGFGVDSFGLFSAVFNPEFILTSRDLSYLPGDSLKFFVELDRSVDPARLAAEAANEETKHLLTALKHSVDIAGMERQSWPSVICNGSVYVEAIVVGPYSRQELSAIRVRKSEYLRLWNDTFDARIAPDDMERLQVVTEFAELEDGIGRHGIVWELIDD